VPDRDVNGAHKFGESKLNSFEGQKVPFFPLSKPEAREYLRGGIDLTFQPNPETS